TASYPGGRDPWKGLDAFTSHGNGMPLNWHNQGGDAGLYSNDEIHAVRILAMEPTTDRQRGANAGRRFWSHAMERLRIMGEIPLRKFDGDKQPKDPDGQPDTSFLAKIPADTAFTFQTIDKDGLLLNMSQTWHQLRPGEVRHDCGGCHAHSQKPTLFKDTLAARADYKVWDLVSSTPLLVDRIGQQPGGSHVVKVGNDKVVCPQRGATNYDSGRLTIKRLLDPEDEAIAREALPGIVAQLAEVTHADLLEDPEIQRGSCVVRTAGGGEIDGSIGTQIDRMVSVLLPRPGDDPEPESRP
ncbi:MAG: hypothetical protein IIC49_07450, partial [Planctomycetes bacterium]|nr:hypothetical protein [Planctomycetota bacterium]